MEGRRRSDGCQTGGFRLNRLLNIGQCGEHACYLKYQNRRAQYVNGLFNIVNWDNVAERYDAACT